MFADVLRAMEEKKVNKYTSSGRGYTKHEGLGSWFSVRGPEFNSLAPKENAPNTMVGQRLILRVSFPIYLKRTTSRSVRDCIKAIRPRAIRVNIQGSTLASTHDPMNECTHTHTYPRA